MYTANEFPYTDFNKVNLDWISDELKADKQHIAQNTADIEELKAGGTAIDYVTPEMFGAKGDGVTDDTVALQAAVDSGKLVLISKGVYKITNSVSALKLNIIGEGSESVINYVGTGYLFVIEDTQENQDSTLLRYKSNIKDLYAYGNDSNGFINIDSPYAWGTVIDGVKAFNFKFGIRTTAVETIISNCHLYNYRKIDNSIGIYLYGTDETVSCCFVANFQTGCKVVGGGSTVNGHFWTQFEYSTDSVGLDLSDCNGGSLISDTLIIDTFNICVYSNQYSRFFCGNLSVVLSSFVPYTETLVFDGLSDFYGVINCENIICYAEPSTKTVKIVNDSFISTHQLYNLASWIRFIQIGSIQAVGNLNINNKLSTANDLMPLYQGYCGLASNYLTNENLNDFITGGVYQANGANLTNSPDSYSDSRVVNLPILNNSVQMFVADNILYFRSGTGKTWKKVMLESDYPITTDSNGNIVIGTSVRNVSLKLYGGSNKSIDFDGDIIPITANAYSIGTQTQRIKDLWVGNRMQLPLFLTADRPTTVSTGCVIYDKNLGKPIYYNGSNWYDFAGNQV